MTALTIGKWALNEHNRSLWENNIQPGDVVLFHSTHKSDFSEDAISSIIGFGYVAEGMVIKNEYWWVQEVRDKQNYWPYVVPLQEIYLFSDIKDIDFTIPVDGKSPAQVKADILKLTSSSIAIRDLNGEATSLDSTCPAFPVNGSASRVNKIFEELLLERNQDLFIPHGTQTTDLVEKRLAESIDVRLSKLDKATLLAAARAFDNPGADSHSITIGPKKVRRESQIQKRRVAALEDYTCQLCGFQYGYLKEDGKQAWIVHVDHIVEKSEKGGEILSNLWVLCPNCHAKKSCGMIRIDLKTQQITERELEIKLLRDNHLFV